MNSLRLLILTASVMIAGCTAIPTSQTPYQAANEGARDSATSQRLTEEAAAVLVDDPDRAETLLRSALAADLYNGLAHNNLGVLLLQKQNLYGAAQEFQWAARLMPGHPDPRMNLALTFERAGRIDEAVAYYGTALEVFPGHIPSTQALVRCQLRHDRPDERTDEYLKGISLKGESDAWQDWARLMLAKRNGRSGAM